MTETTFIEACKSGNVDLLEEMSRGRKKITTKSRSKEYDNLFQRGLFEMLGNKKEKEVAEILCAWCDDVDASITEKQVMALLARGKYEVISALIKSGLNLSKPSFETRYKNIFDKMFKSSIRFARVEEIEYLMSVFDLSLVDTAGIIKWLANEEEMAGIIDEKLKQRGCNTLLNFLIEKGVSMDEIISILN